jgi:endonuclease/exonuclease/phosphatase (EEP) superfamily protein YafD
VLFILVCAVLPWAWFLVRDLRPEMGVIAAVLPLFVLAGLIGASILAAMTRRAGWLVVLASILAFGVVTIVLPRAPQSSPPPVDSLRLSSANIHGQNPTPKDGVASVLAQDADVLIVVEDGLPMQTMLGASTYRYEAGSAFITVYSRYPLRQLTNGGRPLLRTELLRVRVFGPHGPFILYAVHSQNPLRDTSFGEQLHFVDALVDKASAERQPVVLAGDFNMSDRSQAYREMDGAFRDAMRVRWAGSTYERGIFAPLLLRIDHIFESRNWCAESSDTFSIAGSDHEGVASTVGPCPGNARPVRATPAVPPASDAATSSA